MYVLMPISLAVYRHARNASTSSTHTVNGPNASGANTSTTSTGANAGAGTSAINGSLLLNGGASSGGLRSSFLANGAGVGVDGGTTEGAAAAETIKLTDQYIALLIMVFTNAGIVDVCLCFHSIWRC